MLTRKILIVDDELIHLESIMDVFEESENAYTVLQAFKGKEALKIAEKELPDLIITDWEMPEMSGIELIKKLKRNERTKDIPVIMCTGVMTSSENLDTALQVGAVDYVRKPIDKIELIARTKANLHLADSYKKIASLNESKDRIYSIIGHDLRGPVGNIKSFLEFAVSEQSNLEHDKLLKFLSLLIKQSSAAYNILENLLIWANSQKGIVDFNPEKQKIAPAFQINIDLLENSAAKKDITIYNEVNDDLIVNFDLTLITTVLRNLLANAIKFSPKKGRIIFNVEQTNLHTIISITDSGIGISPERIETLFDNATFEATYGTDNEKGSGLGLKLCKFFVEKHNGKLWVESELGKGSSFKFTIPR